MDEQRSCLVNNDTRSRFSLGKTATRYAVGCIVVAALLAIGGTHAQAQSLLKSPFFTSKKKQPDPTANVGTPPASIATNQMTGAAIGSRLSKSNWIWSPKQDPETSSYSDCFFRKKFTLIRPEASELYLAAGDEFELYINGQLASKNESLGKFEKINVNHLLRPGVNLIAVKVAHLEGEQVGLALKLRIREAGESRWRSLYTDSTWKTRLDDQHNWFSTNFADLGWLKARSIGPATIINPSKFATPVTSTPVTTNLSSTTLIPNNKNRSSIEIVTPESKTITTEKENSGTKVTLSDRLAPSVSNKTHLQNTPPIATNMTDVDQPIVDNNNRTSTAKTSSSSTLKSHFKLPPKFSIEKVVSDEEAGSLIAMAFNEFGKLLLSREGGPLLLADIDLKPGDPNRIRVISEAVNTCQGILPLNGSIFVTGMGPEGLALYHLLDENRDGVYETTNTLLRFKGDIGEHGPHGLTLGNDGMIYVVIGNACSIQATADSTSPYLHAYEGDVVPRYEDPGGHAVGVKSPGGTVVRISVDGKTIQTVAGGLRNAYDLAFDRRGDLIVHDSDMESDIGMSWYRPTTVYHVHDGAELGWRSGWAKYPDYYLDQTRPVAKTGRGSPAGSVLYQHLQFPAEYHDTLFLADWSEGRILALRQQPDGAGFKATTELFLSGKPLNVVDLDVGEDGSLYFCTGGRGTKGGVFRINWNGEIPKNVMSFKNDITRVIRHPQPNAAWARQNIATLRLKIGDRWDSAMKGIVAETGNIPKFRTRALDNMVLYGPFPSDKMLSELAGDKSHEVRTKAAQICGLADSAEHIELLTRFIKDNHPRVRRAACESMIRLGHQSNLAELETMLISNDRIEAAVARRMLERIPVESWGETVLTTDNTRLFIQGSMAMMVAQPSLDRAYQVLARISELMDGYLNDQDFVDVLRVTEMAFAQGQIDPDLIPAFAQRIRNEFPSGNGIINRELSRLLGFLHIGSFDGRLNEYLLSEDDSYIDKTHVALHLQTIGAGLESSERIALIEYLENVRNHDGGGSYSFYLQRAVNNLAQSTTSEERNIILKNAHRWPNAMVAIFHELPQSLDTASIQTLIDADKKAAADENKDAKTKQMRLGVIAILARNGDLVSMEYLRNLWQNEVDRRSDISIGLAQQPSGENWAYLVSSLSVLDDQTSDEVLTKLTNVSRRPRDAAHFRQVIMLGYRLRSEGAIKAAKLLEHWGGESIFDSSADWKQIMAECKDWFEAKWPEESPISIEQEPTSGRYSMDQILSYLEANPSASAAHGQTLFNQAQCAKCHRLGTAGTSNGPDLNSVASRFSQREIVEAIIHPSRVISDQYRSKTILNAHGETISGLAIKEAAGAYSIVTNNGDRIRLAANEIEDIKDSVVSGMPENLLDSFSLKDIADLILFMEQGNTERFAEASRVDPTVNK